jgi:hypothetical protein
MNRHILPDRWAARFLFALVMPLFLSRTVHSAAPEYRVAEGAVELAGVGPGNPLIYDNDWWFDVFDNNYLWAQASLGSASLRGNIVTRDMWDWQKGYHYSMQASVDDARKARRFAVESGLQNIPDFTIGSDRVLLRPESGNVEDTESFPSDGSRLIVAEAQRATPDKPLLIVAGGPLTTVANALLTNPEIGPKLVVFNLTISSYGYNGKDAWSVYVVAKRTRLVEWGMGQFWERNSVFRAEHFAGLPQNPFCDDMRRLIASELGQANQLGDGAPLVWLWQPRCWSNAERRTAVWRGHEVRLEEVREGEVADVLGIPKASTRLDVCREEFFRVLADPALKFTGPR